jgi:hypothetical protein
VTSRICPRCHSTLQNDDSNSLVYCWNCGAPQVLLSEELRDQLEQQQLAAQQPATGTTPSDSVADPTAVLWQRAIRLAGLSGAIFIGLSLLSAALPLLLLFTLLWTLVAPIIVLGIYAARTPRTQVTTGFGAQLGLLCGLAIAISGLVFNTAILLFMRYGLHQSNMLDAQTTTQLAQMMQRMNATPEQMSYMQWFIERMKIPEFHVGYTLLGTALVAVMYLFYSSIAGAFAGLLRSRTRTV